MISKCATHAIVVAGTSKQCVDLLDRGLCAALAQFEHTPHRRRQIFRLQQILDRFAIELLCRAALLLQPLQQPCNLADAGNGAAGDLGELCIDLRCCGLCNLTCSFSEFPINIEAALVDLAAQYP